MDNPCPEVQRAATKAIKNIIYTNDPAKLDMRRCGGLESTVRLVKTFQCFRLVLDVPYIIFYSRILRTTSDPPLRDLTSAVLWNLSSCDSLKQIVIQEALQILAKLTVRSEPKVFTNVTGCLRNLSSAGAMVRKKLRSFKGKWPLLTSYDIYRH